MSYTGYRSPTEHKDSILCLCSDCVVVQLRRKVRDPNPDFPDCSECYLGNYFEGYEPYYCKLHEPPPAPKRERPNKADKDQKWAFTLTMPPDYVPHKPIQEAARLIMTNGITNKPYENTVEWAYVLEHTEQGTPHIHGVYKTPSGRRIAGKYF